jgi:glucose-1-phosphate adenylyltransferase
MQKCVVEEDSSLDHVILDKEVYVTRGNKLAGEEMSPTVFTKKSII